MRRFVLVTMGLLLFGFAFVNAQQIIHDAEYYILKAQYGEKWSQEDVEIQKKLAALEKKHGSKPNIVHIMWDDAA
ncbi:MAG: hypothetical protein KAI45_06170, partial [Melioribacteraceae bacterium]|nr:hypothetical protein [Melioribacteraceae bacterium]